MIEILDTPENYAKLQSFITNKRLSDVDIYVYKEGNKINIICNDYNIKKQLKDYLK